MHGGGGVGGERKEERRKKERMKEKNRKKRMTLQPISRKLFSGQIKFILYDFAIYFIFYKSEK